MVEDWRDAVVVPIPKKGDLRSCDNWRGISLLDVVGKLLARIVQERLQVIGERVLPESQCGFRKGRGCVDMLFVARQLVEKSREHDNSLFIAFFDLRKAYDSVPRPALWSVLEKYGVPPKMLSVIRSFHEGMLAEVQVEEGSTDSFEVKNGLRQGCPLAPSLFNLFFAAMVSCWRARCPEAGVVVKYKHGRRLVGDRTAKSRLSAIKVTETQFADDVAVYCQARDIFERAISEFVHTAAEWGLSVSAQKSKALIVGRHLAASDTAPVQVDSGSIDVVQDFTYLGSNITDDGEVGSEVGTRIAKAARAFGCLKKAVFQNPHLSTATRRKVYQATVMSVLLYGAETWATKAKSMRRLNGFHNHCVRTIMGVSRHHQWKNRISTRQLAVAVGIEESMDDLLMKHRLRWLGHVARMEPERLPKQVLFGELLKKRPSHGVKRRWRDLAAADVKAIAAGDDWYNMAQERKTWKTVCKTGLAEVVDSHRHNVCAANLTSSSGTNHLCPCGRSFRRQGDLTRHGRFCSARARAS